MRAITITRFGGPDVLQIQDKPDPTPKAGEVRIKVHAAGLNFAEVMARKGLYPDAPKPPMVMGYEAAGVIDQLGEGVTGLSVGQRVLALTRFGGHAEFLTVPQQQVLPMPEEMSFEEGAALPVNYVTAYHMLFRVGGLQPRQSVLVHMAAGGVGIAVLQLAKTVPNVTVFGTASKGKHDFIRNEGCTHPIDYRSQDYVTEVRRLSNGKGVDLVLDALGGDDWRKGYDLLRPAGKLIAFGFANMAEGEKRSLVRVARQALRIPFYTPMKLMSENKSLAGVNVGHLWNEMEMMREELEALVQLYREKKIKPHIDAVIPFAEAARAHGRIESRQNIGKVVLVP